MKEVAAQEKKKQQITEWAKGQTKSRICAICALGEDAGFFISHVLYLNDRHEADVSLNAVLQKLRDDYGYKGGREPLRTHLRETGRSSWKAGR